MPFETRERGVEGTPGTAHSDQEGLAQQADLGLSQGHRQTEICRPWRKIALAGALGATALLAPGGLGDTDNSSAAVGQWVSEFRAGIASPVVQGAKSRIDLLNVDSATELRRKVRLTYLDRCVDSETQGQFSDSIVRLQNKNNDNTKYIKIENMMESGLLTIQLKANRMAAQERNFAIDYDRCSRAPWTPYVKISMPGGDKGKKKLEQSIKKSECDNVEAGWLGDKIWILNPQRQDSSGETIFSLSWFGVDGFLNIPVCTRVDRRNYSETSPFGGWTRDAYPKPLIFQYRTSELEPTMTRVSRDFIPNIGFHENIAKQGN